MMKWQEKTVMRSPKNAKGDKSIFKRPKQKKMPHVGSMTKLSVVPRRFKNYTQFRTF